MTSGRIGRSCEILDQAHPFLGNTPRREWSMAFGQASGPPATAKQLAALLALLQAAGHSDFRDARGPMGFTQRQAGGKFTRDEADSFIAQLEADAEFDAAIAEATTPPASAPTFTPRPKTSKKSMTSSPQRGADPDLSDVPDESLAAELQRRGWIVMEP